MIGYASEQKSNRGSGRKEKKTMKQKATILLGVKNNQVITADLELRDWNGHPEFSASFNVGEAFNVDDIDEDYRLDYYEMLWSDCYDAESKLDLLDDGNRTKKDVFEQWDADSYDNYHDIKDCSCTDYELYHDGVTINFETIGCGQHDVREDSDFEDMRFTDKQLFNNIMYYWDNFHLKEVNKEQLAEIERLMGSEYTECSGAFDEFIVNNIDWSVL